MDCKINQERLIDFQFGQIDPESRAQVEAHLLACPGCLEEFFLLKRDVEAAPLVPMKPSAEVKAQIHHAFLAYAYGQLRTHPRAIVIGGLMAAAATLLLILSGSWSRLKEKPAPVNGPQLEMIHSLDEAVDSGAEHPEHINII